MKFVPTAVYDDDDDNKDDNSNSDNSPSTPRFVFKDVICLPFVCCGVTNRRTEFLTCPSYRNRHTLCKLGQYC